MKILIKIETSSTLTNMYENMLKFFSDRNVLNFEFSTLKHTIIF